MERRHRYGHGAGGMVIGGLIVLIGLLILLDNMGIVRIHDVWRYWPVLLIVVGVSKILESRSPAGYVWGGVVTLAGALLLLDKLDIVVFDFNLIWPLLLIAFGLSMLLRSMDRKRYLASATGAPGSAGPGPIDENSNCNAFAIFGGSQRRVSTQDFRGGDAVAVFGGVEFDLRKAGMTVDQAVIDVNVVCGGLEVRVPDNWTIVNRAMTIFGGVEDKTIQSKAEPNAKSPHLVITGSVIFGGISLLN
jgi:predicted membrane protein